MKTKFCPNCGNEIPLNENICRYCLKDTADTSFLSTNSGQYHYSLETFKPVKISKINSPIKETKNVKKGNFLTYADRAQKEYGELGKINDQVKNSWNKMSKRLIKI